jgi:hypothetical protein
LRLLSLTLEVCLTVCLTFLIAVCTEEESEEYVVKDELYNAFKDYCKQNGYPIFSEKKFTEWLKKEVTVTEYRPSFDGEQKRAWRGIKLLPTCSPSFLIK